MNPELFRKEIRLVLAQAHEIAVDQGQTVVRPEHVLLSLLAQEGVAVAIGDKVDVAGVKQAIAASNTPRKTSITPGKLLNPSPEMEGLFRDLWQRGKTVLHQRVHLVDLIGVLMDEGSPNSVTKKLLPAKGLKVKELEQGLLENIPSKAGSGETPSGQRNLRTYGKSLIEQARAGNLAPVVGRHREVRRLMQVLCRREKNNPILIGPPGIGKSSIVHSLAQRIANGQVPSTLKSTDIFLLDLGTMAAGAELRGGLEERVKGLLGEIKNSRGRLIIFVDELPTIFRKGGGVSDLGAMLKPALASGDLQLIAVTTTDEYRQYIEKDSALERHLQPIHIAEPSIEEAVPMVMGGKGRYETYHGLRIDQKAVRAAVTLSARFIQDRFLPDKALDLLDEAAAKVGIEWDGASPHLGDDARGGPNGKNGSHALLASGVLASRERLAWQEMVVAHGEDLGWTPSQAAKAENSLEPFRATLARTEVDLASLAETGPLYKTSVDDEDVAEVVSTWTGIPLSKLMENERAKLLHMESALHQRVVGQNDAVVAVSNAVRLARAGMKDPNRPVGSFLFLGPTGVGKTELCRALAEFLFDDESAMIRVDMSEYMDKHTVSRLIGAPPGYIGYEDSGQLTESIRRKPFSIVLFDEIEKAHPDIFNILLQIMDDGRLTDGHGRTVDFKNAIVTLTSNVGGHLYRESLGKHTATLHGKLMDELRGQFRPEFLNRLDAIVFFDLLAPQQIEDIVDIQIQLVNRRLAGGGIRLEVDQDVKVYLAGEGYDVLQGARPLKRLIQREVLEPLARQVLQGDLVAGDIVMVSMAQDKRGLRFGSKPGDGQANLTRPNDRPLLTAPEATGHGRRRP